MFEFFYKFYNFYDYNLLPLYKQDIQEPIDYSAIMHKLFLSILFGLFLLFQTLAIIIFQKSFIYILFILVGYSFIYYLCLKLCKCKYI
jgi:hypothetical protein